MLILAGNKKKEEGNLLFQASRFEEARDTYTAGIQILEQRATKGGDDSGNAETISPSNSEIDDNNLDFQFQTAVLYSNRGNCCLELGDYRGAAQDSSLALEWISSAKLSIKNNDTKSTCGTKTTEDETNRLYALRDKNQWRLARALFYAKDGPALKAFVASLGDNATTDIQAKIDPFVQSLEFFDTRFPKPSSVDSVKDGKEEVPNAETFLPQLVRSSLSNPNREYYYFGHDFAESALENVQLDANRKDGRTDSHTDENNINILYGGIGDGRNAFATIMDVHHRKESVNLHITMNDINAATLVKDILVLVVSEKIAKLAPEGMNWLYNQQNCHGEDEEEAIHLMCVIYYSCLSYVMPRVVYEKLQALVREVFLIPYDSFSKSHPWLYVEELHWPIFQRIASHWVDTSNYSYPLLSPEEILSSYGQKDPWTKPRNFDVDREKMAANGKSEIEIEQFVQWKAEQKRMYEEDKNHFLEMYRDMSTWTQTFMERILRESPKGASKKTLLDKGLNYAGSIYDNMDATGSGSYSIRAPCVMRADKTFSAFTKTILPPSFQREINGLEIEMDLSRRLIHLITKEESSTEVLREFQDLIHEEWEVNPVIFDPDRSHEIKRDTMCAVLDFAKGYLGQNIRKTFSVEAPEHWDDMLCSKTLFELVALFFVNTGHAIRNLVSGNNLSIELSYGSILDFGVKAQLGVSDTLVPRTFSRMFLSNVPDYVGLLSTFISLGPLMENASGIEFELSCNVLLNTPIFQSYDEYVCGTCASTAKQVKRLLGFELLDDDDDDSLHLNFNRWGICSKDSLPMKPVSAIELKTWLYRLYLCSVLPPHRRQFYSYNDEQRPNTIGLFLFTCKYCLSIGYPIHWITTVLDRLLTATAKKPLTTKARIANESPSCTVELEMDNKRYNLSAFRLELGNQLSIFIQNGLLPDSIVSIRGLPLGKQKRYSIEIDPKEVYLEAGYVYPKMAKFSVGFFLERTDSNYGNNDADFSDFASIRGNDFACYSKMQERWRKSDTKFRTDLLENGDRVGHLFSCAEYNTNTNLLTFDMCEDLFQKFGDYFLSLVLTDSWKVVKQTPRLRLSDAVIAEAR